MKAISISAPAKSGAKFATKRAWMRFNVALRSWSRRVDAAYSNILVTIAAMCTIAGIVALAADGNERLLAYYAIGACVAIAPTIIRMSYDSEEGGDK